MATELIVSSVNFRGVTITTPTDTQTITWDDLRAAASQASNPNAETELAAAYSRLLDQARRLASQGPLRVDVVTQTGGATWEVWCVDAFGAYDRSLMRADEGMSHPHRKLAEIEADEIRDRLRKSGRLA